MTADYKKIRIFVASPGDVQNERDQLARVIEEINVTISAIAPEKNIGLEFVRWETHVHPGLGRDAQEVINHQIPKYDIFVGILWKRMGTPTAVARSGTEEEFHLAYNRWLKGKALPVLFYFCQQPFPPPRTKEEVEQLGKVVDFRSELSKKGLVADYPHHEGFADVIRPHLMLVLGKMFSPADSVTETVERISGRVSSTESHHVRQKVRSLAQKYETIRDKMGSGHDRTRKMETVVSEMKAVAVAGYSFLSELSVSHSNGERLAAITMLQTISNPAYIEWLAERFSYEKPFIGYHTAIALLHAVRELHTSHATELQAAIAQAKKALLGSGASKNSDRYMYLDEAEKELKDLTNGTSE